MHPRSASLVHFLLLAALLCMPAGAVQAAGSDGAPSAADYERALGLRERWMHLTEGLAGPVRWLDAERYEYRRTVVGGFEFVQRGIGEARARPAFDQARIARALSRAGGHPVDPLRLPFAAFERVDDGAAIRFDDEDGRAWRCELARDACQRVEPDIDRQRPRGWGVVRDMSLPADGTPQRSPDGRREAFVRDDNLAVRDLASGEVHPLSHDGSAGDFYDPESIVWSPDSKRLAAYRVIPGTQRRVTRVESAPRDSLQPRVHTQLYPKPGDAVDIEQPVIFDVASGRRTDVNRDLFAQPFQLSPLAFRSDGRTLAFRYVERTRKRVRLIEIDAESGATRTVVEESSGTFVNDWWHRAFFHDVGGRGREILWMSERDGWNHLYLVDGRTGRARRITGGPWAVREVIHVDEARRRVWFAANGREPGDPYMRHVYRVDFDGRQLVHMTPGDGWHTVDLSPDLRHYTDTWSRVDAPNVTELRSAEDGRLVDTIERGDASKLLADGYRPPEAFAAPGRDGRTMIWGLVVRPTHYDPARRYPVIENIYAGPHDAYVPKRFWPFERASGGDKIIGMQALADLGFIVVQIDGMGTMHRSKAFHDVAWKRLEDAGFPDRIAWHRALAARDPSYDIAHGIGIYGASAGGQNALHALLFHPDVYTVAVAYNGCYDNRMDKISWNEQWLGWPVDDSYLRASVPAEAHRLRGKLLLLVGEQDANVDPSSTYQVADALIRAGKDFDLLVVPGGGHATGRSNGPIEYAQRRQFDFFVRHLLGRATPDWNAGIRDDADDASR